MAGYDEASAGDLSLLDETPAAHACTAACIEHYDDPPPAGDASLLGHVAVAVVGLGYVGLRVATAMAGTFPTVGFDVDETRLSTLRNGIDCSGEVAQDILVHSRLKLHSDPAALADSNVFIVAVPTPLTPGGKPDLGMLEDACTMIGKVMAPGATVVIESTVYPGTTEEVCGPALERASGLRCGVDFQIAYSPERLNPGDTRRDFASIVKLVAAQDRRTLDLVAAVYGSVVGAGVHRVDSIKVAEAAKLLENTQRDVNIALINEMAQICGLLGIRAADVLRAAGSKWNFLPFTPGLVGGHCVGIDPYYLADAAQRSGYHPRVILAARQVNEGMPAYVASRIVLAMAAQETRVRGARVGLLGITFKEGVPDIRNSKTVELAQALALYGIQAHIADPRADVYESRAAFGIELEDETDWGDLDVLVLAVPHAEFMARIYDQAEQSLRPQGLFVDLKAALDPALLPEDVFYMAL
ncbi:nucleotide sugar dehydrogenase [Pseudoxanthomonas sp. Root65]|uniref:nucleotide sugar dehydrogenase n=1 Tax=Pseudoxanthomonas sp. Root65 TaxID=1736576 RepID=UPI0009EB9873|nr:nucleotide sugar dehydrogenase [Pseudoxanthomonas sp. Root65]